MFNRFCLRGIWTAALVSAGLCLSAQAQTTFTYQGYLRDGGVPANGNYDFLFRLFDETNTVIGSPVFVNNVVVANGLFTVNLDFGNLFPGTARSLEIRPRQDFTASNNSSTLASFPTILAPRVSIQRSPYAIFANTAPWSGLSGVPAGFADGIDNDTTYTAGAGLQLVGTTFSIANLGVQTGMIANNAVTNGKIANGAVNDAKISDVAWSKITGAPSSFPPSGAAGGDLGGTYPNPQVTGLTLPINETADLPGQVGFWITNSSSSGINWGGVFYSAGSGGVGLLAANTSTTGTNVGVLGRADSPDGWAGYFTNRVGIGSPTLSPQLSIAASDGDVTFANPQGSITFPATGGANAPMIQMFASGTNNADRMVIAHSSNFSNWGLQYRDSNDTFHFLRAGTSVLSIGNFVGVGVEFPSQILDVGGRMQIRGGDGGSSAGIWLFNTVNNNARAFVGMETNELVGFWGNTGAGWSMRMNTTNGNVGIGATPLAGAKLYVNGTTRTKVLEIEGADLAEKFPFTDEVEPGMVVEIDPDNPGKLRLARGEYNQRVAGVVAGANDLSTGVVLGNLPESERGAAVAMSGRVWVYCDATDKAVEPGMLLTTANKPGFAMAVRDASKAHGSIIGKAMTRLEKGKTGMVLVLVNLH